MNIKYIAIEAAKAAGALLKENLGNAGMIEFKGEIDLVTEMDRRAEDLILGKIKENFPGHGVLTEESAGHTSSSGYRWIVDPLDGTTNYAHSLPVFCVSIAFEDEGSVIFGTVYDPVLDELFTAERGKGAYLNGRPINVSKTDGLPVSLLATGFPYDVRTSSNNNLDHFSDFAIRVQAIRRMGSAALDLCYTACGRFDAFWELKLRPWDVAAAGLIVEEAGGMITDFRGAPFSVYGQETLASNGLIHENMIDVLQGRG